MITFWIGAALLIAIALAFLARAAMGMPEKMNASRQSSALADKLKSLDSAYRDEHIDEETYQRRRQEVLEELGHQALQTNEKASAKLSGTLLALILIVPLSSVLLYQFVGQPEAIDLEPASGPSLASAPSAAAQSNTNRPVPAEQDGPAMDEAISGLAARLSSNPNNPQDWLLLGRSYLAIGQQQQALQALNRAIELDPESPVGWVELGRAQRQTGDMVGALESFEKAYSIAPDQIPVLVELGQTMLATSQGGFPPRVGDLAEQAIAIDPEDTSALLLGGLADFEAGNYVRSVQRWEKILPRLEENGTIREQVSLRLTEARQRAGNDPDSLLASDNHDHSEHETVASNQPESDISLTVRLTLDAQLSDQVSPGDTLFVFARAANGPKMPLAIQRFDASELPLVVILDESMSMSPAMNLSMFDQVIVGARISKSGNATPQPGDMQGLSDPISNTEKSPIELNISTVL